MDMGDVIRMTHDRPAPLWREMIGDCVRRRRRGRDETLTDTAGRAGISPQYLSEIERGLKDPSSEVVEAVAGALGMSVLELTTDAVQALTSRAAPIGHVRGPLALAA